MVNLEEMQTIKNQENHGTGKWKFETGNRKLVVNSTGANLNTNSVRKMYHKDVSNKCSLCGTTMQNFLQILSSCSMFAQKEYKRRHDKVV